MQRLSLAVLTVAWGVLAGCTAESGSSDTTGSGAADSATDGDATGTGDAGTPGDGTDASATDGADADGDATDGDSAGDGDATDGDTTGDTGGEDGTGGDGCSELDEAACAASDECSALTARAALVMCAGIEDTPAVFQECVGGTGTAGAPWCARSPETGGHWVFPSGHIPEGWVDLDLWPQDADGECCTDPTPTGWTDCAGPDDCALVELACCDHCNGGAITSVNADFVDELSAWKATCADPVACTEIACPEAFATCEDGTCGWSNEPPPSGKCDGLGQADCEANPACAPIMGAVIPPVCDGDYDGWMKSYGGCGPADIGCGDAETCGFGAEQALIFPSTCLPAEWNEIPYEACCDPPPADWQECSDDADCVVLEMGCCDHCNGGWLMSVNQAFSAPAGSWKQTGCENVGCTKIACAPVTAKCKEGKCTDSKSD